MPGRKAARGTAGVRRPTRNDDRVRETSGNLPSSSFLNKIITTIIAAHSPTTNLRRQIRVTLALCYHPRQGIDAWRRSNEEAAMRTIRWCMIGCGDVTEIKSGPGFQKANHSALV